MSSRIIDTIGRVGTHTDSNGWRVNFMITTHAQTDAIIIRVADGWANEGSRNIQELCLSRDALLLLMDLLAAVATARAEAANGE